MHAPVIRDTIVKARGGPLPGALRRFADALEPEAAGAFLRAIEASHEAIDLDGLARAIEGGNVSLAEGALDLAGLEARLGVRLPEVLRRAFTLAGEAAVAVVDESFLGGVGLKFNLANPLARRFAEQEAATRVREIGRDTIDAIRDVIARSVSAQIGRVEPVIREIRSVLGLLPQQIDAVEAERRRLLAEGLDPATVERRVARYAHGLLTQRAETIAANEIMTSLNLGALAAYQQAVAEGWVDANTVTLEWIASPDACEKCQPLDGVRIRPGESFEVGLPGPPKHIRCKCTTALVPLTVEELAAHAPVTPPKEPKMMASHFWHALVKSVEPRERRIDFQASAEPVDRQGDSMDQGGIDLSEYRRNPILLRDHDLRLPVGLVDRLAIERRDGTEALVGSAVIGDDDLGPHVRETWRLIQAGILRGISIGFQAITSEPLARSGGLRFTRSRLLEISVVSVPACATCLIERNSHRAAEIDLAAIPADAVPFARAEVEAVVRRAVHDVFAWARVSETGELP